jgi:hypothetical protein
MTYNLKREFDKRRSWVTKFVVQGEAYGGSYDLTTYTYPTVKTTN